MSEGRKSVLKEIAWRSAKYILTLILLILNATGVAALEWYWVLSPIFLAVAFKVLQLLAFMLGVCVLLTIGD